MFWYALVCFNSKLHTFDARLHRALDDAKPFVLDFHLSQGGIPPASQTWWQYNPCRTHTTIYKYIQPISNQYWEGNQYESVRSIPMSFSEKCVWNPYRRFPLIWFAVPQLPQLDSCLLLSAVGAKLVRILFRGKLCETLGSWKLCENVTNVDHLDSLDSLDDLDMTWNDCKICGLFCEFARNFCRVKGSCDARPQPWVKCRMPQPH